MHEWRMDRWKYFDITHRCHIICNPMSIEKLEELIDLLKLSAGARVLDIGSGKAELLVKLVERFGAHGVGVDTSPFHIADAEKKRQKRVPDSDLEFVCLDGARYHPDAPESFDLGMCIGASWVFGGHRGTIRALKGMVKPGGLVMTGEPFWRREPPEEYLAAEGCTHESFSTHPGNVAIGEEEGLTFLYCVVSNQDDWDRYEGLRWYAAANHARSNPKDPDLPELMERARSARERYLMWGRDTLGWAIYLFRKPG